MTFTEILAALLLVVFTKFLIKLFSKPQNFPPGPPHLPIIGSLPFLSGLGLEKYVGQAVAAYGPVTGLFGAAYPLVVINDWKLAKTLFNQEEFCGRPK